MAKNIIYCYSATGNCLDMAKNIAKLLGNTDIVSLRTRPEITDASGYDRVGFIIPCYGGGMPGKVKEYLGLLNVPSSAYTFGIAQCAAYMGTGLYDLNKMIPLDYWQKVTHQCTYIPLFPHQLMLPVPMPAAQAQKRSEKKARAIAAAVLEGRKSEKHPPNNIANRVEFFGWPTMAGMNAKKFHVSDECIGCGMCAKLCPTGNIQMVGDKPVWGKDCFQCVSCLQYCPKKAIAMGKVTEKRGRYHNVNISAFEIMKNVIHVD